ncbi:nuclease [Halonotius aquaticus]|uniref:Nuclease n=1 Tax=Halonotius aquaticus TaxID=2216978 RepID=A0A3A6PML4_9EURY|nr:thermonuclease family protein [Halonotius aquaticus]RJX42750.1 nuclease [Halonotius aquaticus]
MQHRRVVSILAIIAVVALAGCSGIAPLPTPDAGPTTEPVATAEGPSWNVTVTRVIDGDTVEIRYANGTTETVRLLGVDTPETPPNTVSPAEFEGIPDTEAGRDHLVSWGGNATEFAERKLAGTEVRLVVDPESDRRGGYGRLLAYIYVDGENFNSLLLSGGYARLYESEFRLRDSFAATEATAQQERVGLWNFE